MHTRIAIAVLLAASCGTKPSEPAKGRAAAAAAGPITQLELHYHDRSLPPQNHRSYVITLTQAEGHVAVDSYGNLLQDKHYPMTPAAWADLGKAVDAAKLTACTAQVDLAGCTGSSSDELAIQRGTDTVTGTAKRCGGKVATTICGDSDAVIAAIKATVPDLADLTKPGPIPPQN